MGKNYVLTATAGGRFAYVKIAPLWWQKQGFSFAASGYGSRIPTQYMVFVDNRWRRVYCYIYSNIGTLFIGKNIKNGSIVNINESAAAN